MNNHIIEIIAVVLVPFNIVGALVLADRKDKSSGGGGRPDDFGRDKEV
jgi:hypothetical protein